MSRYIYNEYFRLLISMNRKIIIALALSTNFSLQNKTLFSIFIDKQIFYIIYVYKKEMFE